jgi:hypothetical protein
MAAKKKTATPASSAKSKEKVHGKPRAFAHKPSQAEVLSELSVFFDLLKNGKVKTAGSKIAHKHDDWFPHQIQSLWQDLVGPWLEENDREFDLDDDSSWRNYAWCAKLDADLDLDWDGKSETLTVNLQYDGEDTDVSADFSIVKRKEGWMVQRDIIHVA